MTLESDLQSNNTTKFAFVSGATGGVGQEVCKKLLAAHIQPICLVRASSNLDKLKALKITHFCVCSFDAPENIADTLKSWFETEKIARNDIVACYTLHGVGKLACIKDLTYELIQKYDNINYVSHMLICQFILTECPNCKEFGAISSMNAIFPAASSVLYAGPKAYIEKFMSALRCENPSFRVVCLEPPAIRNTNFQKSAEMVEAGQSEGGLYKPFFSVSAEYIAKQLLHKKSGIYRIGWVTKTVNGINYWLHINFLESQIAKSVAKAIKKAAQTKKE